MDVVIIAISSVIGAVGGFFLSYLREKAKNFATKEDIAQITDAQDKVHTKYNGQLETLRSELERQSHALKMVYETKFQILHQVWNAFTEFREAAWNLSPTQESFYPDASDEAKNEIRRNLLEGFERTYNAFWDIFEKNRPFYPKEIYEIAKEIQERSLSQKMAYQSFQRGVSESTFWKMHRGFREFIESTSDKLCQAIQKETLT